ncbi:hypothetical protein GH714_012725 [Hevea brasiliensis]|uniref:Uncharacterized protein n=1 Tax=Hevea brasiliensis TaxID=3981 RepID=A0A6A6MYL5_HEVBR|nr:hypothetical protein GH714_012725 [Hevea brasiliensis]
MASSGYSAPPPPVFSGEGYSIWAVKMKAYLKAFDLWEVTETGRQPGPLREDPTLAQIKAHSEECAKGFKALPCIHASVSEVIFTRIMACETAKEAWDLLKAKFEGSALSKQMSVLNLRREFESIWLRKLLKDLANEQVEPTVIWCDNKSAIAIASNPIQHGRTKHIKVKFHFLREAEKSCEIKLLHCKSDEQLADVLTKALPKSKFEEMKKKLRVSRKILKEEC